MKREVQYQTVPSLSPGEASSARDRPRLEVEKLMAGRRDVVLVHGAEEYLLRITSKGRLILTK
ncbi:MAG: hemin uptake protein HemP [Pseudomonadota bacterium]